ncbi:hypothetical protein K3495_g2150 [Podosphaera aphanis]|nr:hypothetical protein K3495_g2150 [Podosphaera aphanis]
MALRLSVLFSLILGIHSVQSVHPSLISQQSVLSSSDDDCTEDPLPLVIWHGLGDTYDADNLISVANLAETVHPGTFTYRIRIEDDATSDRSMTFFGNVTSQIDQVCADLAAHPILATAPAIDALGFSQGGQFLRGYVERCNRPPVRSLVTFGAQHNGISEFTTCKPSDFLCRVAFGILRFNTWNSYVQSHLVPAQYFRNPASSAEYEHYLANSNFLADINNERALKNETYKKNLALLKRFVMYVFDGDQVVSPKESGWFTEVNGSSLIPLRERQMYKEDWLGLKALDERGALKFESTPGPHMSLDEKILETAFKRYFGSCKKFE